MRSEAVPLKQSTPEAIQALADNVMKQIAAIYTAHHIEANAVQQQMLASHVRAMAARSLTGEALPDVEAEWTKLNAPSSPFTVPSKLSIAR